MIGLWHYDEYPRIAAVVSGGAAQRAGIRVGDVLLSVDGLSITTDEGSQRFSELRAGDTAHLTLDRNGKSIYVDLALDRGGRGGAVVEAPSADAPNFTTRAHGARVDVWSDGRVVQSTDSAGATILRIGNTVIRLSDESPLGGGRAGRGRRGGQPPTN
jgi:membrane-associated protease RseP (regulator of RpoE activity)